MSSNIYALPVLGRYGLTHSLLSWARACVWCDQNDAIMLAPFWLKLRIGPYLRRERDKRNYFMLFHRGLAVSGFKRLAVLAGAKKIDVGSQWPAKPNIYSKPVVLCFHNQLSANEKKSFHQIVEHGPFLRERLMAMTRQCYHPPVNLDPFIAVHVRLGDFSEPERDGLVEAGSTNTRLPLAWYADRITALRTRIGINVPTIIFSDGSDAELSSLLSMDGVRRGPRQQSVTDLLHIGLGVALIASGSGFSLWGAFLGSTPRISYPGQSKVPISDDRAADIDSDFGEELPSDFVKTVLIRLKR